jgi:hypothetical protein
MKTTEQIGTMLACIKKKGERGIAQSGKRQKKEKLNFDSKI